MEKLKSIYLDHQATSPMDERVLETMLPFFREKFGNPHSAEHAVGWESSRAVADSLAQVAALIGADSDEIIFTSGATEANNLALIGLANHLANSRRNRMLVSAIEHKSVLAAAHYLKERFGYQVELLPVDKEGKVSARKLEAALDETVSIVSIMAVNNEIGTIQDIRHLADVAHASGALFHADAAQAPVAVPMETFASEVDLLSLSAHKMGGPPGIGALYIRRDLQKGVQPLIHGGGQQNGLRSGTVPLPLCVGMGAAAAWLQTEQARHARAKLKVLRDKFLTLLHGLPWEISINGPNPDKRHPGNANVCFHGFAAQDILDAVQPLLAASTGSACTSGISEPSHVLRAIGMSGDDSDASVRFSLGFSTRDEDVETAVEVLAAVLGRLSEAEITRSA